MGAGSVRGDMSPIVRDFVALEFEIGERAAFAISIAWFQQGSDPGHVWFALAEYEARGHNFGQDGRRILEGL